MTGKSEGRVKYNSLGYEKYIKVTKIISTDLGQICTAESENDARFSQPGQVFVLRRF